MSFHKKISEVQATLNAPKNQKNTFGKYNYRSCEDIVQAVKPLLAARDLYLVMSDEIVCVSDRVYVKSTAIITDGESSITSTGMAREAAQKKGMDDSQITGSTSSYARKYALNGLLAIDDNKDADANEYQQQDQAQRSGLDNKQLTMMQRLIESKGYTVEQACGAFQIQSLAAITADQFNNVMTTINGWNSNNG